MSEIKLSDHQEHDEYMPNALPKRKMFSSIPVSDAQVTEDDKTGDLRTVRKMAKVVADPSYSKK